MYENIIISTCNQWDILFILGGTKSSKSGAYSSSVWSRYVSSAQ